MQLLQPGWSLLAIILAVTSGCSHDTSTAPPRTIAATEIGNGTVAVVGALGLPLGTVCEVEGRVVELFSQGGEKLRVGYALEIESVNGRSPTPKPILHFTVAGGFNNATVAPSPGELEAMLHRFGKEGRVIVEEAALTTGLVWTPEQIEEARRTYVGSRHRLVVYEQGRFGGTPSELPRDVAHQGSPFRFGFHSELVVLGERDMTTTEKEP